MRNTLPFALCPLPLLSGQHGSGEDEVLEGNRNCRGVRLHALPRLDLYHQRGALEEPDVAFLYRLLLHDLTRNLQQAEPHSSLLRLGNHQVVKARLPLPTKNMQLGLVQPPTLFCGKCDFVAGDRRIHCADVHHRLALLAVQVRKARHWLGTVQCEDESPVLGERSRGDGLALRTKGDTLPVPPLVLAQVQDIERSAAFETEQPLARGVDGEAAQVAANPATPELFSDGEGCAGPAEEVSN